jgi:poly-gamma-glutamate synthesis protein (capsule biosynthesis protein)
MPQAGSIRLFLCGDVKTGRGIDQVLPYPADPTLHEPYIRDARSYVERAERVNGAIPRPVEFDYIWGDALAELDRAGVDLRIINLETSSLPARTTGATRRSTTACIRATSTA